MPTIATKIDAATLAVVRQMASEAGISPSAVLRDALGRVLASGSSTYDAGWREGRAAGYAAAMRAIHGALADLAPDAPRR